MANYLTDLLEKYADQIVSVHSITEISVGQDYQLALSIDRAYKAIMKYTGIDEATYSGQFTSAVISLALHYFNNDRIKNQSANGERIVSSMTQGSRTVSYSSPMIAIGSDGLTDDVRAMLPLPKLKVL